MLTKGRALVGQALMGPPGPLWAAWALVGPPGPLWPGPLWPPWALVGPLGPCGLPLGPYGPGPCGPLGPPGPLGRPWALAGRALLGRPGLLWVGPLWAPWALGVSTPEWWKS